MWPADDRNQVGLQWLGFLDVQAKTQDATPNGRTGRTAGAAVGDTSYDPTGPPVIPSTLSWGADVGGQSLSFPAIEQSPFLTNSPGALNRYSPTASDIGANDVGVDLRATFKRPTAKETQRPVRVRRRKVTSTLPSRQERYSV